VDDTHSERPSAVTYIELMEQINQCIRDNRRIITVEIASERSTSD